MSEEPLMPLPPGVVYLKDFLKRRGRALLLGTVLSVLSATVAALWQGPTWEWRSVVRLPVPPILVTTGEVASFIKARAAAMERHGVWSGFLASHATEARLNGETGVIDLTVRARSAEEARDVLTAWPRVLSAAYKGQLDERRRKGIDEERGRLWMDEEHFAKEVSRLEKEIAFLRPLVQRAPELAEAYSQLIVSTKAAREAERQVKRQRADLSVGLAEFDILPATAAPVRTGYTRLWGQVAKGAIFGGGGVLFLLVLLDLWRAADVDSKAEGPKE